MRRREILAKTLAMLAATAVPAPAWGAFLEWSPGNPPPPRRYSPRTPRLPPPPIRPLAAPAIRIEKSSRTLVLLEGGIAVRRYHVGLGRRRPFGPKRVQGDGRTPEGRYRLCSKNESSACHLFLGISYPGAGDARLALENGIIDAATAARIEAAEQSGEVPPWDTAL